MSRRGLMLIGVAVFAMLSAICMPAQETPTEREAAKDVLRKIDELEKSIDAPALVAKLTAANPQRDQVVATAKRLMDTELLAMADDITRHPEIGFKETRSIKIRSEERRVGKECRSR